MSQAKGFTPDKVKQILAPTQAPLNRYYRYPACNLFRFLIYTPITPNAVSFFHLFLGLIAAYFLAQGTQADLIVAAILYEIRIVLDCLDGALARWKNMASLLGRHIDEISDALNWIGIMVGSYFHLRQTHPSLHSLPWLLGATLLMMASTTVFDIYYRYFSSALEKGQNGLENDLRKGFEESRNGNILAKIGFQMDLVRFTLLFPGWASQVKKRIKQKSSTSKSASEKESLAVQKQAHSFPLRATLHSMGWLAGDNSLFILIVAFFFNQPFMGLQWVLVYNVTLICFTLSFATLFRNSLQRART